MFKVDELLRQQEKRLLPLLDAWNEARKHLENAMELAETREREYREVAADVQRKLDALHVVIGMSSELEDEIAAEQYRNGDGSQPQPMLPENATREIQGTKLATTPHENHSTAPADGRLNGLPGVSSRQLFPANWRSK